MKKVISDYLKQGSDGPYFFRMVETVLARDKNWVFWKMASCPPIKRDPVSAESFVEAKEAAQKMATSKRLRPNPLNAVPLDFLANGSEGEAMEQLKDPERHQLPELEVFKSKIADDDFEIDMPTNGQTKAAAVAAKASKSWRALRIAARFKLAAFDKIDDPKNISVIFEDDPQDDEDEADVEPTASEEDMPSNRDPIILSSTASSDVQTSALREKLMSEHKGVFGSVVRHAVRDPEGDEVNGKTFHFVKAQEFNQLRDGDRLVEYGTRDGVDYGTSSKAVEAVVEGGKVPIIELDVEVCFPFANSRSGHCSIHTSPTSLYLYKHQPISLIYCPLFGFMNMLTSMIKAAQFAKDMDFSARYILIKASSPEDPDESKTKDLFDTVIAHEGDVDKTASQIAEFIYAKAETNGDDANMADAPAVAEGEAES